MAALTRELRGSYAFIERNMNLVKRYWGWEFGFLIYAVAASLSVTLIGKDQGSQELIVSLVIGATFWNYLSVVFSFIAETITWERWEGTLEYTMMAPVRRITHLLGSTLFALIYGFIHTAVVLTVLVMFFGIDLSGCRLGHGRSVHAHRLCLDRRHRHDGRHPAPALRRARRPDGLRRELAAAALLGRLLQHRDPARVDAGSRHFVPGTYILDGIRQSLIHGVPLNQLLNDVWPLLVMAVVLIPAGAYGLRSPSDTPSAPASSRGLAEVTDVPLPLPGWRPATPCGHASRSTSPQTRRPSRPSPTRAWPPPASWPARTPPTWPWAWPIGRTVTRARDLVLVERDGSRWPTSMSRGATTPSGALELQISMACRPEPELGQVAATLLDWAFARGRQLAAGQPPERARWFAAWCSDGETWTRTALTDAGFTPERHFTLLVRPRLDDLAPPPPLPAGVEVRPAEARHRRAVWEADVEAFRDHWGTPPTRARRPTSGSSRKRPAPRPVAGGLGGRRGGRPRAGGGRRGGERGAGVSRGRLDSVAVRRPWRRRGLATALVVRALHAIREAGYESAVLGVDVANPQEALDLYRRVGFEIASSATAYRRPFDP